MTAAHLARSRPALAVEAKQAGVAAVHEGEHAFDEAKHPRDKHGRFISIGAHIDLGDGRVGKVTHVAAGEVTVARDDGKTVTVKGDALKNTAVTHGPSDGARAAADASAPRTRPTLHAAAPHTPSAAAAPANAQLAELGIDERALRAIDKKIGKKNEQIASAQNANRMSLTRSQRELKLEDDLRALQEERGKITKGHMVIWNERRGAYQIANRPRPQEAHPDKETSGGTTAQPNPQRAGRTGSSGAPDVAAGSGGDHAAAEPARTGRTVSRGVPALKPGEERAAPQLIQLAPGERVLRDSSGNDYLLRQGGQLVKVDRSGPQPKLVQGYALPHQLEDVTPSKGVFSVDGSPVPARLGRLENPGTPLKLDFQPSTGGLGMSTIPMTRPSDEEFNSRYREAVETYRHIQIGPAWNKALREDRQPDDSTGAVATVRELIDKSSLEAPVVTFRGGVFPDMEPGTVIHDKGFMSLTVNQRIAKEFALNAHGTAQGDGRASIFTLTLPEGTKVGNLMRDDVGELVLPPGSAVRIKSKNRTGTFNNYEVELVPAGTPSDAPSAAAVERAHTPDAATPTVNVFHGGRYGGMQYIDVASNSEEIQQQIERVFGFEDPKTGFRIKWDYEDSRTGLDKLELHGTIVDRNGNRVGKIDRSATMHDDGRVEVHDDHLKINDERQAQAFTDALHRHTLTTYPLIGVEPSAPDTGGLSDGARAAAAAPRPRPTLSAITPSTDGLTKAQQMAAKNKWKLPEGTVDELRAQLAAVKQDPTPSAAELVDQGMSAEEAAKKAKQLRTAAYDRAYKIRVSLQAAIDTRIAASKSDGIPEGWSRVGADAKEQAWRADAKNMYDALKADGVDLPDFQTYYARVTERMGMKFDAGNDLTRKVGKTQVTINVGDLPQEHWARAAQDVEAVVGRDDAKNEVTFTFRSDSFKDQPGVYGYTNLGANHVQVHPAIYTDPGSIGTANLMRSARGNVARYVIAHEYGHARGAGAGHDHEVRRAVVHSSGASLYASSPGPKGPVEAAAEAYAEWAMTDGSTSNEFAKAVAGLEGWK